MSKHQNAVAVLGVSAGVGAAVYLLLQLLLAVMVIKGILKEEAALALQIVTGGLGSFAGALLAASSLPWGRVASALTATAGIALAVILGGLAIYGEVLWTGNTFLRLGIMLSGGVAAGVLGAGGKRKGKRRRKAA